MGGCCPNGLLYCNKVVVRTNYGFWSVPPFSMVCRGCLDTGPRGKQPTRHGKKAALWSVPSQTWVESESSALPEIFSIRGVYRLWGPMVLRSILRPDLRLLSERIMGPR